ncbi:hypothetical protein BLNAU_23585 [Blattamonas nauphoetae]|uniref:Uncharacterized protein n=1 Tax=Blattamonas nauphoetae TaxID=2049346 RepID=A0ABQ9WPV0_9EUKA|nr:hypothetical protein BLNAU_23585 [Blattamonas nauphoetae]
MTRFIIQGSTHSPSNHLRLGSLAVFIQPQPESGKHQFTSLHQPCRCIVFSPHPEIQNVPICLLLPHRVRIYFSIHQPSVFCTLPMCLPFSSHESTSQSDVSIPGVLSHPTTLLLEQNMNNREQCKSVTILRLVRMEDVADTVEGRLLTDRKGDWGGGVVSNWMMLRNLVGLNDGQFGWMTTVASQVPAWSTPASDGFSCLIGDDTEFHLKLDIAHDCFLTHNERMNSESKGMIAVGTTISTSPGSLCPDCCPFLNWDEKQLESEVEKADIFRSLVVTVMSQPALNVSVEAKAVKFLESVIPHGRKSADAFLGNFGLTTDYSLASFTQSIGVLLSSTSRVIATTTMEMIKQSWTKVLGRVRSLEP